MTTRVITPFSCVAKILKVPVFRLSLGDDLFSRLCIKVHNFFSRLFSNRKFHDFDPVKAQTSLNRFCALGAQSCFVTPRDGKGQVQMMTFCASDLEAQITAAGGTWGPLKLQSKDVLAITPPANPTQAWTTLEEKLTHFRWKQENGMFITCECADEIPQNGSTKCFLYTHSTSGAFTSDWKRAGFYLGMKQDFCFFDNGNTWKNSGRRASEESFYLEAEAVYNKLLQQHNYPAKDLWIGGSCGGAPVAAYLKYLHHTQGINFFVEQSFPDLDDFVKPISSFCAPRIKGAVSDPSSFTLSNPPPSAHFSPAELWQSLQSSSLGKFVLVEVQKDEHIDKGAYNRYYQLAQQINTQATRIVFDSNARYRHADDFFNHPMPTRDFLHAVFN